MKKRILAVVLCLALLGLCACGAVDTPSTEPDTSVGTPSTAETSVETTVTTDSAVSTSEAETPTEPETFIPATIDVDFTQESRLAGMQYETFTATESPQTKIILSTNATVRDFKVLALSNGDVDDDGNMHFDVQELYTLDRLTADRPLVVSTTFYGLIPNNGISYVDETGATRTFAVDMSGEDGSLDVWEFD